MSVGTHVGLVLAVLLGVSPRYQRTDGQPGVREVSELAIDFDLVAPVEAAPPPVVQPTPAGEPRVVTRRGRSFHGPRPGQERSPMAAPLGPNPLEPPPFEEAESVAQGTGTVASAGFAVTTATPPRSAEPASISAGEAGYLRTYEAYPSLPRSLWVNGRVYSVLTQICVSARGEVSDVTIKRGAAPELDRAVMVAMRSWRYRPRMVEGAPRPFCHLMKLDFTLR